MDWVGQAGKPDPAGAGPWSGASDHEEDNRDRDRAPGSGQPPGAAAPWSPGNVRRLPLPPGAPWTSWTQGAEGGRGGGGQSWAPWHARSKGERRLSGE